jgi:hypothetical protein
MSDLSLARATIIAALIGLLGSVIGAVLGNRVGTRKAGEEVQDLEVRMRQQENAVKALQGQITERDEIIRKLTEQIAQERTGREVIPATISTERTQASQEPNGASNSMGGESAAIVVKEVAGMAFSLKGCRLSNSVVTCEFSVVNHDKDRRLEICTPCYGVGSRLVDSEGNEYSPEAAYLGSGFTHRPDAVLASEVPLKAGIKFNGIESNPASIKLLELGVRVGFSGDHTVQFHDIALR